MSKKESEFDRIARMRKIEKEALVERRKSSKDDEGAKKKGKSKTTQSIGKKSASNYFDFDEEYEYMQ